jgi:hypothetical protein
MYYFCETMGGEAIGWSLTECTDRNEAEYRIYMRMRSDSFVPLAESFSQFVLEVCLGDAFDRIMEEHGYAIESPTEVMSVFVAWPCDPNAVGDSNCV